MESSPKQTSASFVPLMATAGICALVVILYAAAGIFPSALVTWCVQLAPVVAAVSWICGNGLKEIALPLSAVAAITLQDSFRPARIILEFNIETPVGRRVAFLPPLSCNAEEGRRIVELFQRQLGIGKPGELGIPAA